MGLESPLLGPRTSRPLPEHPVYPYLLRRVKVVRPDQVWATDFCIEAVREAPQHHSAPDIFNSDQGAQFTDADFVAVLKAAEVRISMDGKGFRSSRRHRPARQARSPP